MTVLVVAVIVAGGGSFYAGMKFQQSRGSGFISPADFQNLRNLSPEDRQARIQQFGGAGGQRGTRNNGGFVSGEVISKDDKSMTVKKGDKVRIIFKNAEGFHDFKIDEFNVATQKLQAGQEDAIEFTADKTGSFEYYCSIGEHRAMGMKGVLTVE